MASCGTSVEKHVYSLKLDVKNIQASYFQTSHLEKNQTGDDSFMLNCFIHKLNWWIKVLCTSLNGYVSDSDSESEFFMNI